MHPSFICLDIINCICSNCLKIELISNSLFLINGNFRWDIGAMDQLPEYLKQCFLTLYNSINEIAHEALIHHGVDVMQYLKKVVWTCNINFKLSNKLSFFFLLY